MSRYIDAEWIRNIYADFEHYENRDDWTTPITNVLAVIDDAPSIDIVFCNECKFENTRKCPPHRMGLIHDASDYCSYGIRKTDGVDKHDEADRKTESSSEIPDNFDKDINVRSKDERQTEGIWNAGYKTGYDKGYKDAQLVKERTEVVKDLVKDEPQTVLEAVLDRQTDEDRRKMAESVRKAIKTEPQTSKGGCTNCADRKTCEDAFTEVSQYCGAYEPKTEQTERKE